MEYYYLSEIPLNEKVIIKQLSLKDTMRRRLLDLGFAPGTFVTPVFYSVAPGMTAYHLRGSMIALRQKDARKITVCKLENME